MEIWEGDPDMEAFHKMEKALLKKHHGKTAVFCNGKLVAIDEDIENAIKKAKKVYKGKEFFVTRLFSAEEQAEAIL